MPANPIVKRYKRRRHSTYSDRELWTSAYLTKLLTSEASSHVAADAAHDAVIRFREACADGGILYTPPEPDDADDNATNEVKPLLDHSNVHSLAGQLRDELAKVEIPTGDRVFYTMLDRLLSQMAGMK